MGYVKARRSDRAARTSPVLLTGLSIAARPCENSQTTGRHAELTSDNRIHVRARGRALRLGRGPRLGTSESALTASMDSYEFLRSTI
jgi:hypothetical protein